MTLLVIGLTGGIASGKSSAAKYLASLGARIIDADLVAHEAYSPARRSFQLVVDAFGADVLKDGQIHRPSLGKIVWGNKAALDKLSSIVWPATLEIVEERLKQFESEGSKVAVVEAAALIEAGWKSRVTELWVTYVPEETACQRVMERNSVSREEALRRIQSQSSNDFRLQNADFAVNTDREVTQTQGLLSGEWGRFLERHSIKSTSSISQ
eukprot:TRINITY_DN2506_c0_g1_i1.p1 TRINITY_DN2506_c0_g1~~TRINITY_DN2506_c0_g1_i1.p1  ORF type:complete len:211 (+),score=57.64 TRINITY_DN2506_c0_g1_i1:76-708(+)